jgi:2-dehydropantoate 2-reductase
MPLRILIVGAGAVGGYFGARLVEAGRDVTFLVRAARAEQLRREGLRLRGRRGESHIRPSVVQAGHLQGSYELVLLAVKAYGLEQAMRDLAPAVRAAPRGETHPGDLAGSGTLILPLLNGMRHLQRLDAHFGSATVLGGLCRLGTQLDATGHIVQLTDYQQMRYGERDGSMSARLQAVDASLGGAGFDAQPSAHIVQEMWDKWVQLASLGAINCLLRGAVGEVSAVPGGHELILRILAECVAIATAWGQRPADDFVAQHSAWLSARGSPTTASMYRDMQQGAPVEAEQILGDLVERGRARGVDSPLLQAALVQLRVYEAAHGW